MIIPKLFFTVFCVLVLFSSVTAQQTNQRAEPFYPVRWSRPTELPDHIILTFSGDPSQSQGLTWRTDTSVKKGFAEIAISDGAPGFWRNAIRETAKTETMDATKIKLAEVISNYHSVKFENLLADTMYAYRVGDGVHWSEWFQFRTASKTARPFSFLYVGDAQNYILELWSRLIREGFKKAPEARFIIHAGDLINNSHSERQWHEWHMAGGWLHGMLPSVPVPGNHEYGPYNPGDTQSRSTLSVQWNHQFTLPENGLQGLKETSYYYDYQGVRFVCLNSNRMLEAQAVWMDSILTNNPNKWAIATFHHPVFSGAGDRDNKQLRDLWKPVFDKHNVDLVLTGHDHTYTRGQAGPDSKNASTGVNTRDGGTVYVVSVSGGKMYTLSDSLWKNYNAKIDRTAENTQLFQVITVNGDRLQYQAFTATGQLYDAFDLVKQKNRKNKFIEKSSAIKERRNKNTIPFGNP
ncbi:purple acid phosphatase family protein [Flavitalea sp.]|nr:metallophosphoesterase family protein [Flavitalea sp.]